MTCFVGGSRSPAILQNTWSRALFRKALHLDLNAKSMVFNEDWLDAKWHCIEVQWTESHTFLSQIYQAIIAYPTYLLSNLCESRAD